MAAPKDRIGLIRQTVDAMAEEITVFLADLVRAESVNPPGDTTAAAAVIQEKLKEFGCPHELRFFDEQKPNIIVRAGAGEGKRLCFNSHMDTVPAGETARWTHPPFGGEIADGNLYGRGSADAKGCAAAMLMAARALEKAGINLAGALDVAIVSDEETGGSMGTQYLLEQGALDPDLAIIGEITSNSRDNRRNHVEPRRNRGEGNARLRADHERANRPRKHAVGGRERNQPHGETHPRD